MKIVVAYKAGESGNNTGMNILVWPDSAMIRSGKPLFVPDGEMRIHPGLVTRINAVGKSIRHKFADRYFCEVAPAAFLLPLPASNRVSEELDPYACDIAADYTVVCGDFIPSEEVFQHEGDLSECSLTLSLADLISRGEKTAECINVINVPDSLLRDAIVAASERNTLKTGDLAGFIFRDSCKATPETLLTVTVDGKQLLKNKLK